MKKLSSLWKREDGRDFWETLFKKLKFYSSRKRPFQGAGSRSRLVALTPPIILK
jgi:hypothetical protein